MGHLVVTTSLVCANRVHVWVYVTVTAWGMFGCVRDCLYKCDVWMLVAIIGRVGVMFGCE